MIVGRLSAGARQWGTRECLSTDSTSVDDPRFVTHDPAQTPGILSRHDSDLKIASTTASAGPIIVELRSGFS